MDEEYVEEKRGATQMAGQGRDRTSAQGIAHAVTTKQQDNLLLGETLVSIGLLHDHELSRLHATQAENRDVVESLLVASAIRSRLGDILLRARFVTTSQLEHALEVQRESGGMLGEILRGLGWLEQDSLDAALAAQERNRKAA